MPSFTRASSPVGSEYELDITSALADDSDPENNGDELSGFDTIGDILNAPLHSDDEEGEQEAAFISAQQAAHNRKGSTLKGKTVKKGGGFQAMGLNHNLLKAITRKGFSVPTPIQRKTIPLLLDGLDVVGMARTGSGKTAAFVIPLIEKLKTHSVKIGARAVILSPSRELALQTLKVVKDFAKGTDLACVLLVGGDSLEDQFGFMAGNPDIIIATPGRFMHLKVEMGLDLKSVEYIVFDEADRLFEQGFASQLMEILVALPTNRQTLLFSATLPKALTEFAKAGLTEPRLVRLDADAKISTELESVFFSVTSAEKEGALIHLLKDVIKVPMGESLDAKPFDGDGQPKGKKRKRTGDATAGKNELPYQHATIVFAATKHHVEYLARLISLSGYPVSYVYGALDQVARRNQVARFRTGETKILVVTDVAARGIDIPVLANVINYDFPPQPKVYVHRVGRTARAGRRGWSYSFVRVEDAAYLIDLQLFLGRKLVLSKPGPQARTDFNFASDVIVGTLVRDEVERSVEAVNKFLESDIELDALRSVAMKGEKQYNRSRPSASTASVKRAKELVSSKGWGCVNPYFADTVDNSAAERAAMLARVASFRPGETVFEIGQHGANKSDAANIMKARRAKIKIDPTKNRVKTADDDDSDDDPSAVRKPSRVDSDDEDMVGKDSDVDMSDADEADVAATFTSSKSNSKPRPKKPTSFQDTENFMSYEPTTSFAESRGYSITTSFAESARAATFDLTNDDSGKGFAEAHKARGVRWDKKAKKYVQRQNDEDGSKGTKMIIGEGGQKIAASFKSGRFDAWKSANRITHMPRVGEDEGDSKRASGGMPGAQGRPMGGRRGGRIWHKETKAPKAPIKGRDDYEVRKKRYEEARTKGLVKARKKSEIKTNSDIVKHRQLKDKRREKNNRPSKKRKL